MLEGIALCPPDVGRELSTPYWLLSLAMNVMMIANLAIIAAISYNVLVVRWADFNLLNGSYGLQFFFSFFV